MDNDAVLRKLQLTQLEILKVLDEICLRNGICYSLCGGTLLGAVRHKGYIPWDDDLDIAMRRNDYEKFIQVWNKEKPSGYILQNKDNSPDFPSTFSKIRKDHSTFISYEWEKNLFHTGIFVDIFPFDRIPNEKWKKSIYLLRGIKYLIYTRGEYHTLGNGWINTIVSIMLKFKKPEARKKYCKKFLEYIKRYENTSALNYVSVDSIGSIKKEFSPTLCDEYTTIEFEGKQFMCFKEWNNYLTNFYGDYMQLPPLEERTWTHHPIIIDFEHNLEEITDETEGTVRFQNQ